MLLKKLDPNMQLIKNILRLMLKMMESTMMELKYQEDMPVINLNYLSAKEEMITLSSKVSSSIMTQFKVYLLIDRFA